jgi:2-amino-4-hydroxy-6-hydroxymethyldihydropteridine diphosphokinase
LTRVYLGIGSNIDRGANVRAALARLRSLFPGLIQSQVFDTKAIGFDGNDFYNLVVGFDTELPLPDLDDQLHAIEDDLGRDRSGPGSRARTIDLDILLYGDVVERDGSRRLPREDIDRYAFVLGALAEIAPRQHHPISGKTFLRLWQEFDPIAKSALRVADGDW